MVTGSSESHRLRRYERWHTSFSPFALVERFLGSPAGTFLANAPIFQLKENLKLEPWMRVLDVGCGAGSALRLLDERLHCEHAPVGIDVSSVAISRARAASRVSERPPAFARASALALPFRDGTFDLVISSYLIRELDDEEMRTFLLEVKRVLAPGGLALLWDCAPTGNSRLDRWNEYVLSRGTGDPRLRSTRALMALGELAGFEYVRPAKLRPFLFPPIPRASVLLGKPPEGWQGN